MEEITSGLYRPELGKEFYDYIARHNCASAIPTVVETENVLMVFDPGYQTFYQCHENGTLGAERPKVEGSFFRQIEEFSERLHKPVQRIFLSHSHTDHILDAGFYKKRWPQSEIVGHKRCWGLVALDKKVEKDLEFKVDRLQLNLLLTPGHNDYGDDISLWIPQKGVLLSGDLIQPHGYPYQNGDHGCFLPFYQLGDDYLASLKKVLELEPEIIQSGHDTTFYDLESIRTNIQIVERTKELVRKLMNENPEADDTTLASWVFDTIGWERNVPKKDVLRRREADYSSCIGCDLPGILYFITQERKNNQQASATCASIDCENRSIL